MPREREDGARVGDRRSAYVRKEKKGWKKSHGQVGLIDAGVKVDDDIHGRDEDFRRDQDDHCHEGDLRVSTVPQHRPHRVSNSRTRGKNKTHRSTPDTRRGYASTGP